MIVHPIFGSCVAGIEYYFLGCDVQLESYVERSVGGELEGGVAKAWQSQPRRNDGDKKRLPETSSTFNPGK